MPDSAAFDGAAGRVGGGPTRGDRASSFGRDQTVPVDRQGLARYDPGAGETSPRTSVGGRSFHGKVTCYSYFGADQFAISFDSVRAGDPADSILLNVGPYRTPQGIHLGSTKRQLKHAYPHLSCHGGVCKIYQGVPLEQGTRDTEFIVATNGRVIGIAVEITYE